MKRQKTKEPKRDLDAALGVSICEECEKSKPDVKCVIDPFELDLNDNIEYKYLCEDCYDEILREI